VATVRLRPARRRAPGRPVDELNTGQDPGYPSLSGDGRELYFETTRSDGGNADVWIATRSGPGQLFTNIREVTDISVAGSSDDDPEISQARDRVRLEPARRAGRLRHLDVDARVPVRPRSYGRRSCRCFLTGSFVVVVSAGASPSFALITVRPASLRATSSSTVVPGL
jgi:hypothetical protein